MTDKLFNWQNTEDYGGDVQLHTSHAQNSQQDYLNAHNVARAQVGVPNITWDSTVATCAQNYANSRIGDCNLVHSNGSYGENLAKGSGSFTGTLFVLGVLEFSAIMGGGLSLAAMILQAIMMDNALIGEAGIEHL
nr:pathogenesis-related protein 1b [Quercus suber]